jgi:hypothetical protein
VQGGAIVLPLIWGTRAPSPTAATRRGLSSVGRCGLRGPLREGRGRGSASAVASLTHHLPSSGSLRVREWIFKIIKRLKIIRMKYNYMLYIIP